MSLLPVQSNASQCTFMLFLLALLSLTSISNARLGAADRDQTTPRVLADNDFYLDPAESVLHGQTVPLLPATIKDADKLANIVGGSNASPTDAPWQVLILELGVGEYETTGCGGSLITDRHVLTASHCTTTMLSGSQKVVYIGAYQPFWGNPNVPFQIIEVEEFILHPKFDNGPNINDVSIIVLKDPVNTDEIAPVQLADSGYGMYEGENLRAYGFGRLAESNSRLVETLQVADVPYITTSTCDNNYFPGQISSDMFCAGYAEGGIDACQGDSGGPLIHHTTDGTAVQVGIVSWGSGCARKGKPGVYASVPYFYDWIRETACSHSDVDMTKGLCYVPVKADEIAAPAIAATTNSVSSVYFPMARTNPEDAYHSPTTSTSSANCSKKADNATCYFGGECCSGVCAIPGNGSLARVCVPASRLDETPPAMVQENNDKN